MSRTRFGNNFFNTSWSVNSRAFLRRLGMGLADEIEQEIRQAAERTPWLLDLRVGFEQVGGETPQGSPEHVALIHKILMAHLEVTEAHREAILRLAREIEDLNTRIGDLDKE